MTGSALFPFIILPGTKEGTTRRMIFIVSVVVVVKSSRNPEQSKQASCDDRGCFNCATEGEGRGVCSTITVQGAPSSPHCLCTWSQLPVIAPSSLLLCLTFDTAREGRGKYVGDFLAHVVIIDKKSFVSFFSSSLPSLQIQRRRL